MTADKASAASRARARATGFAAAHHFRHDVRVADGDATPDDEFTALTRATYDRIAPRYAERQDQEKPSDGRWFPALEEAFLERMTSRDLIADLGCGPGLDGVRFIQAGFRVVGMDLSASMLAIAARSLGGSVAQADLRALPTGSGSLDGIWCCAALLHVPELDTPRVLQGFRRALKPGGSLALVTALGDGHRLEPVPYAPGERRWFAYRDADRLGRQLRDAGFRLQVDDVVRSNREWITVLAEAI
jgi:SAM-dependent methyltransferase